MNFSLLGICWPNKSKMSKTPIILRKVFPEIETFISGVDLSKVFINDLGNLEPKSYEEIKLQVKDFPVILGGDHSISFAGVKAVKPKLFLSFDAHPDCQSLDLCYWSVTRKIFEENYKTMLFGTRCYSKEEWEFIEENNIKIATLDDLRKINEPIYLSIDFDVLDPSIIPNVKYPEPNGLTFNQVIDAVKIISKNIIAVDFVELIPENRTSNLIAAKLIYSVMAEIIKSKT